ncbi:hypothetical protein [Novosphingobium lentum]|uniref:hypothetical protein n=1 Tax=Novosphingobium lentum TaxID=145287 RepID=UPI0012EECCAE|nr:hypothetical protein [Novosphingobium lentum]
MATEAAYAPGDECSAQPGWPDFHRKLATAVSARDAKALAALAAPDLKLDYGGGSGSDEFVRRLAAPSPDLWAELARIMPLGCAIEGGIVAMPWYFWNLPDDADAAETMLVVGKAVPLRARAGASAPVIAPLDWAMVTIEPGTFSKTARFTAVRTRAGHLKGFVDSASLRSLLAYRLIAERRNGDWRLTAFVAGD